MTMYLDMPIIWQSCILTFILMILISGWLVVMELLFGQGSNIVHLGISIVVCASPPVTWIVALYRRPSKDSGNALAIVSATILIAALLAIAVSHPILLGWLRTDEWLSQVTPTGRLLGDILVNGFFHIFLSYAVMVFFVWGRPEFDRRVSGILFTVATALGYSSTLNVLYVIDHGSLAVLNGNLRLLSTSASFLTSALPLGYFVGHNRFQDMPSYYLGLGVTLSAILNGLLNYAGSELSNIGLGITQSGFSPWPGFVVNLIVLALTFSFVRGLLRRQNDLIRAKLDVAQ